MKQMFYLTTALVTAMSGSAAFAEDSDGMPMRGKIDVSGYTSIDVGSGADDTVDYELKLDREAVTDNGFVFGGQLKVTPQDGKDTPNILPHLYWEGDGGKVIAGQHHGPARTMSVGSDWRGTVPAAGEANTSTFQGATTPRLIYQSPNIAGFEFGASVANGDNGYGNERQYGINYTIPLRDSMVRFGHSRSSVGGSGSFVSGSTEETGVEFKHGKFTASFVNFAKNETSRGFSHFNTLSHYWNDNDAGNVPSTSQSTAYWHTYYNQANDTFADEINTGRVLTNDDLAAFAEGCTPIFYTDEYEEVVKVRDYNQCDEVIQTKYGVSHLSVKDAYEAMCGTEFCGLYTGIATNNRYTTDNQVLVLNDDGTVSQIDTSNTVFVPGGSKSEDGTHIVSYAPVIKDFTDQTSGHEIELAYDINNVMTVNAVKYKTDQGYDRTSIGGIYRIDGNITASLSRSSINDNGVKDDVYLARLKYSF